MRNTGDFTWILLHKMSATTWVNIYITLGILERFLTLSFGVEE